MSELCCQTAPCRSGTSAPAACHEAELLRGFTHIAGLCLNPYGLFSAPTHRRARAGVSQSHTGLQPQQLRRPRWGAALLKPGVLQWEALPSLIWLQMFCRCDCCYHSIGMKVLFHLRAQTRQDAVAVHRGREPLAALPQPPHSALRTAQTKPSTAAFGEGHTLMTHPCTGSSRD